MSEQATLIQGTITIPVGGEIPFQADRNLYIAATGGAPVALLGSSENRIPGPVVISTGFRWSGYDRRIGTVLLRNLGTVPAFVEIITSNGAIERDSVVGGSQIVERSGVYVNQSDVICQSILGTGVAFRLQMPNPAKRIRLLRAGIANRGFAAAATLAEMHIGVAGNMLPAAPNNNAIARNPGSAAAEARSQNGASSTAGWTNYFFIKSWRLLIPATASANDDDHIFDFTANGTIEPPLSPAGANGGFVLATTVANHQGIYAHFEWQEV